MIKILFFAASLLMITGMTSCKKNYTCTCTTTNSSTSSNPDYQSIISYYYGGGNSVTSNTINSQKTKRESEGWCQGFESSASSSFTETFNVYDETDPYSYNVIGTETVTFTVSETTECSL